MQPGWDEPYPCKFVPLSLSVFWSFGLLVFRFLAYAFVVTVMPIIKYYLLLIILLYIIIIYLSIIKEVRESEKFLVFYTQKTERLRDQKDLLCK